MPQSRHRKKSIRQDEDRRVANRSLKREIKTRSKRFAEAVAEVESEEDADKSKEELKRSRELFRLVVSRIDTARKKNILHRNKAARLESKLAKLLQSVSPPADK